ncbi:MAG: pyrimidine dimer DNA glycosylase/endonuclease V [Aigarchaeota archaeon]|nr:pyrimidine dimer DNA glycosylase/endonuclease V [Aigarchaeota archaeon]
MVRLWSIHPKYLDRVGLVAVWREGLLAKRVLEGRTKGYKKHPQILRFKKYERPIDLIDAYLFQIYLEAKKRLYSFDLSKIREVHLLGVITVTRGQLEYEFNHLIKKLEKRDKNRFEMLKNLDPKRIEPNPVFRVVEGEIEEWEKVKKG